MDTRSQRRSGHATLCPVILWANIVQRILKQPGTSVDTYVNFVWCRATNTAGYIKQDDFRDALRNSCDSLGGTSVFGYSGKDIGSKSLRSGAAMALVLSNNTPIFKIMLLGRWKSDAFLVYIRPQVLEFTNSMSVDMLQLLDYRHIDSVQDSVGIDPNDPLLPQNPNALRLSTNNYVSFNGSKFAHPVFPKLHLTH